MNPRDWLLLLLALREATQPLDPVRIQKGLFLLAQEGDLPGSERYDFAPYDYGPFSSAIYSDLESLIAEDSVRELDVAGYRWSTYEISARGMAAAEALVPDMQEDQRSALRELAKIKSEVLTLSFSELLDHVYRGYPEFAERSVFRG